jgi:ferric-dicitrate binding protein FerR (iron transport regulator)
LDKAQLAELAERFLLGNATEKEIALLHEWYDTADKEEIELVFTREPETADAVGKRLFGGLQLVIQEERRESRHRRIVLTRRWIAAASVIFVVVFAGKYFWSSYRSKKPELSVAQVTKPGNDLPPGSNKARLLLGDGSVIDLADAKNGMIRHEAGAKIDKKDGQLIYDVAKEEEASKKTGNSGATEASEMNTIQTPRGGQYEVILADGTKVWLNSASSLSYPTIFTDKNRQVLLKGEAYFEVAEDKNKPFKVSVGDVQVEVLGTHFDVMAYEDENAINTTLLAGAVRVTKGSASQVLAAGQEASMDRSSGSLSVNEVDAEESVAWKDGFFEFEGASIETVMRQLARWYDVDVEYQGKTDHHFRGMISRSSNVSEVFRKLELTGEVHFSMEGKKIIVKR